MIFDARGDTGAEALLIAQTAASNAAKAAWIRRAKRLEELESTAARFSDHRFAVSEALAERLGSMAPIPPEQISVVPCSVDAERFRSGSAQRREVREELGIQGRTVFVYSGSLGSYQIPATIAEIFSEVCSRWPTAHLLVLSRDIEGAARYFGGLRSRGLSTHISAPYDQVGRYLWAGDVGLLLRNPDPVNAVASPVKLGDTGSRTTGHRQPGNR